MTVRMKAVLEYDGAGFFGWQIQKDRRTVQGVLEETLSKRFNRHIAVVGAGRTDRGVHASGQVAHFDCPVNESVDSVYKSLNSMLPEDITFRTLEKVSGDFHARYSAKTRRYRYEICLEQSALARRYCWQVQDELNTVQMRKALMYLPGTHDFKPLAKLNPDVPERSEYRCTVYDASLKKKGRYIIFRITANRFVRGMVRAITGTLTDIGKGKKEPDVFKRILDSADRSLVSKLAPAHGLFLEHIEY